ncbi:MAG: DNA polymerase III subunit alpha [Deltaproteobacteria bacterium]|nr:DNA polymerase III subunit alpha [Deltaproteobacteria bacterium]
MIAKDGFAHLHLHTQYSLLDGAIKLAPLFEQVKALGQRAVGMSDHGNLFGAAEFHEKARAQGVKPIIGCETYIATGSRFEKEKRAQDKSGFDAINHLLLIAQNREGYRNLIHLVSRGYLEGFYYKPRIDLELLRAHSEGLIATSGCLSSMINRALGAGETRRAWELAEEFARIFPGRFYVEIQRHGIPLQDRVNTELIAIARELSLPLLATNDAHYLHAHDHGPHEALLCVGTGTTLDDPNRFRFDGSGFYVKSAAEMAEVFHDLPQALSNTVEIAERCTLEIETGVYQMPQFQVPSHTTREAVLREQAWAGLRWRLGLDPDEPLRETQTRYGERLQMELDVICKMGFEGYFLIVADFIGRAREQSIPVGPGRGSSAGSLVTFSLGITGVDPIEYDILFERFLNPERISMPDIDVDFCMRGRDSVIEYVRRKYDGETLDQKRVAQIITFGKLQARAVIRDVGRAFGLAFGDVDRIAKLVPEILGITLQEAIDQSPELRAKAAEDPQVKRLLDTALALEGLTRHASTHAAGVVIGNQPLIDLVPLYRDPKSGEIVTQYDMNMVERVGLVKFDFLGLRTLTIIADAERLVRNSGLPSFSVAAIPMDDTRTYELLSRGDTEGVFQMESAGMTELVMKLRPKVFREIIPLIALYRTGPLESGATQEYVDRKLGLASVEYFLPAFEEVTSETLGVIVYQDQVLQIANRVSGYSLGEADFLRRAMGKKKPEEMEKQRARFVSGALANGVEQRRAEALFEMIEKFAGYAFPKAHSTAYALITYQTAYLKANHPREFLAALLTMESGNHDKLGPYIQHARDRGIEGLAPELNSSERDFAVVPEGIRFGFSGVKNVGEAAIEAILETRRAGGPFESLYDFTGRIDAKRVNRRVIESLIRAGAFDFTKATRASLFAAVPAAIERAQREQRDRLLGQESLFGVEAPTAAPALAEVEEWPEEQRLAGEKELLGFYVTGHPLREHARTLELFTSFRLDQIPVDSGRRRDVWVGGLLSGLRVQNTKKGDLMARASLEDLGGSIDIVFFPKTYAKFSALLQSESPVLIKGNVAGEPTRPELHADEIMPLLDAWTRRTSRLSIVVAACDAGGERLASLRRVLDLVPGPVPVQLELRLESGAEAVFELPSHKVRVTQELVQDLDQILGTGAARCRVA